VEVRDFLIADGALAALAALADLVGRQPEGALRQEILRALGDARVLAAVVEAIPPGSAELPPEAARLLPLVPGSAALDLLATEQDPGRRAVLVRIAEARLPADAEAVVSRLPTLDPAAARGLVKAIVARAPGYAAAAAAALLEHHDHGLQVEALRALEHAEGEVPTDRLVRLLRADQEPVRIAAAQVLGRRGHPSAFPTVEEALTGRKDCSLAEADALGRALATLHAARSLELFGRWLEVKKGLLGRLTGAAKADPLRWAAVAGLGAHPAPDAVARIEAVAKGADEALRRHCFATLARRRHEGARHG
jgi:HEAT repeat protein